MQSQASSILLIDDDILLQELLALALTSYGYTVEKAGDAYQGMEVVKQTAVDLIVLDMLVPVFASLKFLYWLRQERRQTTPVLVLSSAEWPGSDRDLLEAGASLVAFKPLDWEGLVAKVGACLAPESAL